MAGHGADRRGWSAADTIITPVNVATLTPGWAAPLATSAQESLGNSSTIFAMGGTVHALDPATGALRWTVPGGSSGTPAVHDKILTSAYGCSVSTFDAATGATLGSTTFATQVINPPTDVELCGIGSSVVDDNGTFLLTWWKAGEGVAIHCGTAWFVDTEIVAFTATGSVFRIVDASNGCGTPPSDLFTRRFGEITRTSNNYVVLRGDSLVAYPSTCAGGCAASWTTPVTKPIGPAVSLANGSVAVASQAGVLTVLNEATGAPEWTGSIGASGTYPLAATDSFAFAVDHDTNTLLAFAAAGCGATTCTPAWTAPIGGSVSARPSIAGDVVYVGRSDGVITAFDARGCGTSTCPALTAKTVSAAVTAPPSVVFGRLLVPTATGIETFSLPS